MKLLPISLVSAMTVFLGCLASTTPTRGQDDEGDRFLDGIGETALIACEHVLVARLVGSPSVVALNGNVRRDRGLLSALALHCKIVFLDVPLGVLAQRRPGAEGLRNRALAQHQRALYGQCADLTYECERLGQEEIAGDIAAAIRPFLARVGDQAG